jgi:hypothetical protein
MSNDLFGVLEGFSGGCAQAHLLDVAFEALEG